MKAAVVGAGIMGRLLALSLINTGYQVSIFDKHDDSGIGSCSMMAAGLLTPITELDKSEIIIYELGMVALTQHWPTILKVLEEEVYFQHTGSIVVAHPKDNAEMSHLISLISTKLKMDSVFQKLNQSTLTQHESHLAKFNHAYYFPQEGHIDSQQMMAALKKWLYAKQIEWYQHVHVDTIRPGMIEYNQTSMKFDIVFDCRGLGAKSIFSDLYGIRGELIRLHAPDVSITRPIRFLHPRYGLYLVPRPHSIYLIGASEILSEDTRAISVRTALELLTAAYYLHPGFAEASILDMLTQCRPTLANHLPKVKYTDGLIAVNGLYRNGFLLAPTLVADIMQYLSRGVSSLTYPQLWEQL